MSSCVNFAILWVCNAFHFEGELTQAHCGHQVVWVRVYDAEIVPPGWGLTLTASLYVRGATTGKNALFRAAPGSADTSWGSGILKGDATRWCSRS